MNVYGHEIEKLLTELIYKLDSIGIIDRRRIAEEIGVEEMVIVRERKRYNYADIAKELKERPVFIPLDRKRAMYARKKFEEILGVPVEKRRARIGHLQGYVFRLADFPEPL